MGHRGLSTALFVAICVSQALLQEMDDFWSFPESKRQCSPGKKLVGENCAPCPAGTYNGEEFLTDTCAQCPLNHFNPNEGSTWCKRCEDLGLGFMAGTLNEGSTSWRDCVDLNEVTRNFAVATVGVDIEIGGMNLCHDEMREALWGISSLKIFDFHFTTCRYSETSGLSTMRMQATLPARYAMTFYEAMKFVEVHKQEASSWIEVGDYYFHKITTELFPAMQGEIDRWIEGLSINPDMLELMNVKLVDFGADFQGHCRDGKAGAFCDEEESFTTWRYPVTVRASDETIDCETNAGISKLRNAIEDPESVAGNLNELGKLGCSDDGNCQIKFANCLTSDSDIITHDIRIIINMKEQGSIVDDPVTLYFGNYNPMECSIHDGCRGGVDISGECTDCPGGYFSNMGICEMCPFASWGDGAACYSCPWGQETAFWGQNQENKCFKVQSESWLNYNTEYIRDTVGGPIMNADVMVSMDMCPVAQAFVEMRDTCLNLYDGIVLPVNWDDLWSEQDIVTRVICYTAVNVEEEFNSMCGADFNTSWEEIMGQLFSGEFEPALSRLACYVLKPLVQLQQRQTEACEDIEEADKSIYMGAPLFGIPVPVEAAAILFPILKGMENLVTMDFADFSDAGHAMMTEMISGTMEEFTGWGLSDSVFNMLMEMPRGMKVRTMTFAPTFNDEEVYCDNGDVKRQCDDWCPSSNNEIGYYCVTTLTPMDCSYDECNNCARTFFTFDQSTEATVPIECESCDFPEILSSPTGDTIGKRVWQDEAQTSAQYVCAEGYAALGCNYWAKCTQSDWGQESMVPECVSIAGECQFPTVIEGGRIDDSYNSATADPVSCPMARYVCDQGYFMKDGSSTAYCRSDGEDFMIADVPTCLPQCEFPEMIENGRLIDVTWGSEKILASYECEDGFYLTFRYGECSNNDEGEVFAQVPKCVLPDTCEFPDEIGDAIKESEWMESELFKRAYYICPDGMEQIGSPYAFCTGDAGSEVVLKLLCYEGPACYFYTASIDNGQIISWDYGRPEVQCNKGFELEGDPLLSCSRGEILYPVCNELADSCELPGDDLLNGYMVEKAHNEAWYSCNVGFEFENPQLSENGGHVQCDGEMLIPDTPTCVQMVCEFPEEIENGSLVVSDGVTATYQCTSGYVFAVGDGQVRCERPIKLPVCVEEGESCSFVLEIQNGYIVETLDYAARFECEDGFQLDGGHDGWVYCLESGGNVLSDAPECVAEGDPCRHSEIDNGYVVSKTGQYIQYGCNDGYNLMGSEWLVCDTGTGEFMGDLPKCIAEGENPKHCEFPAHINHGRMEMSGDDWAYYTCYAPFVATYNEVMLWGNIKYEDMSREEAYRTVVGVAWCDKENGYTIYLPKCMHFEEAGHCGLPAHINNGKATMFHGVEDEGWIAPWKAEYQCNEGYHMIETMYGNVGWCREDGSVEIPRCEPRSDVTEVVFKLYQGKNKFFSKGDSNKKTAKGIVFAQEFHIDDDMSTMDGWVTGCSDGFNDYAAGTVCRSFGFAGGVSMSVKTKMLDDGYKQANPHFGWTKFGCRYDDTLITSENCRAEPYEEYIEKHGGDAYCFKSQLIAVQCYPVGKFDGFEMEVKLTKKALQCNAKMYKTGSMIDLSSYNWRAVFYLDEEELPAENVTYKRKSGFSISMSEEISEKISADSCITCNIYDDSDRLVQTDTKCKN